MRKTIKRAAAFAAVLALVLFAGACNIGYVNETTFINRVTETAVKAGVKIEIKYTPIGGILENEPYEIYQGSGVIYAQNESGEYFALTNNHVVQAPEGMLEVCFHVIDCYGNRHKGDRVNYSAEDDLAVVKFSVNSALYGEPDLHILSLAEENAPVNETVVSVGAPDGQFNAVTIGRILRYESVALTEEESSSHVSYPVICHTAVIHGGSSGGMLIDRNLQIVGINYAGASNEETGEFYEGYAVPAENVRAFLNMDS